MLKFKIPNFLKNFYILTGLIFTLWIFFFDANDLITQYLRRSRLKELKKQKIYYTDEIKKIERDRQELEDNPQALEKLAREKYYLKKPKEDVYVISEPTPQNTSEE